MYFFHLIHRIQTSYINKTFIMVLKKIRGKVNLSVNCKSIIGIV